MTYDGSWYNVGDYLNELGAGVGVAYQETQYMGQLLSALRDHTHDGTPGGGGFMSVPGKMVAENYLISNYNGYMQHASAAIPAGAMGVRGFVKARAHFYLSVAGSSAIPSVLFTVKLGATEIISGASFENLNYASVDRSWLTIDIAIFNMGSEASQYTVVDKSNIAYMYTLPEFSASTPVGAPTVYRYRNSCSEDTSSELELGIYVNLNTTPSLNVSSRYLGGDIIVFNDEGA